MPGIPRCSSGSVFVLGLLVGSFLNVVIYRLPIMLEREWRLQAADLLQPAPAQAPGTARPEPFNLVTPGSSCPACRAPIRAWQNIPVLSWLLLGARCAGVRGADFGSLSAGRTGDCGAVGVRGLALRGQQRDALCTRRDVVPDRADRHRHRSSAAA